LSLAVGCKELPPVAVFAFGLKVEDQHGGPVRTTGRVSFVDPEGKLVVELPAGDGIEWARVWARGDNPKENSVSFADARRISSAIITADNCESATIEINPRESYHDSRFYIHGGGRAVMLYEFEQTVRLVCEPVPLSAVRGVVVLGASFTFWPCESEDPWWVTGGGPLVAILKQQPLCVDGTAPCKDRRAYVEADAKVVRNWRADVKKYVHRIEFVSVRSTTHELPAACRPPP